MKNTLTVAVFSGVTFSGKSWLMRWITSLPQYRDAPTIAMDTVREELFGTRPTTWEENLFKNEAVRFHVRRTLITQRPPMTFVEAALPMPIQHQQPFVDMILETEKSLRTIDREKDRSEVMVSVNLKVVLAYADIATVHRRIGYRTRDDSSGTDIFGFDGYQKAARLFKSPVSYIPLPINTSDETQEATTRYKAEILTFFDGGMSIDENERRRRMLELQEILAAARKTTV